MREIIMDDKDSNTPATHANSGRSVELDTVSDVVDDAIGELGATIPPAELDQALDRIRDRLTRALRSLGAIP
jgi:hypothetical protein